MEYLFFGIACICLILFLMGRGIYLDRKKKVLFLQSLKEHYGELRKRDDSPERFMRMDRFYRKHPERDQIDDITWNDLGMDDIFRNMNHTYSAIGEEYLYYCLRSAGKDTVALNELESVVQYFMTHEEERIRFQFAMAKLGYMGKYSLYDYLDHLDYLGERSNRAAYFRILILLCMVICMPFAFSYALIGLLVMLIINNLLYFREKSEIEPYVISFAYIIKLLECSDKSVKQLEKASDLPCEIRKELEALKTAQNDLKPLRKGSRWVINANNGMNGDPAGMLLDYVKMALHVDLIRFNQMLSFLRGHIEQVDLICQTLGKLETCVAIGAYRFGLQKGKGYAIPVLHENNDAERKTALSIQAGYHPLLQDPVCNSVGTKKGILITGSNASGKSTFLKMTAINAILAQTIHTCTALAYEGNVFRIFSSMSLRDDLQGGDSYYIVEIKALKRILIASAAEDRPVLCFVDEVLRGTNTVERIAASTQILKSLAIKNTICFAATHDIELTDLLDGDYENYHFTESIRDGDIVFPYQLYPGKATGRNAIRLLEIMGYDQDIIERAETLARHFLETGVWAWK